MNKKVLLLTFLVFFSETLCFASFFKNYGSWYTSESKYFYIHYTDDSRFMVKNVEQYATEAHENLVAYFNFNPVTYLHQKTHLILVTSTDQANGMATVMPQNTIYLFLSLPTEGTILESYNNWLKLLIWHEYTHVVTLGTKRGYSALLYHIFGTWASPNQFLPPVITEGFSVFSESHLIVNEKNTGRLNSTMTDMMFRSSFCENNVTPPGRIAYFTPVWPQGNAPYLYGGKLMEYVSQTYGFDKVGKISYRQAGKLPFFFVNSGASDIVKAWYTKIYYAWFEKENKRYKKLCTQIAAKGIASFKKITTSGYAKGGLGAQDDKIIFGAGDPDNGTKTYVHNIKTEKTEKLNGSGIFGQSISAHANTLVYSAIEDKVKSESITKINFYDTKEKSGLVFTLQEKNEDMRIRDPYFSKTGSWLVAVKYEKKANSIVKISTKDNSPFTISTKPSNALVERLVYFSYTSRLGAPVLSPDNSKAVFTLKNGMGTKVCLLNLSDNSVEIFNLPQATYLSPTWINDKKIIYSSDITGIFNLYTLDFSNFSETQITNLTGGAFTPLFHQNKIYFTKYSSLGYDLASLEEQKEFSSKKITAPHTEKYIAKEIEINPPEEKIENEKSYRSWKHMFPKLWFPVVSYTDSENFQVGLQTFGSDPLLRNMYSLTPMYDKQNNDLLYNIELINESFFPIIQLSTAHNYYDYGLKKTYRSYSGSITYPFDGSLGSFDNLLDNTVSGVTLGYSILDDDRDEKSNHASLGYTHVSRSKHAKSIAYENGFYGSFFTHLYRKEIASKFNHYEFEGLGEKYFKLYQHLVYTPKLYVGYSSSMKNYSNIGGAKNALIERLETLSPPIRGYKQDSIEAKQYGVLSHQLDFPLAYIYRGIFSFPFIENRISASTFADMAAVKNRLGETKKYLSFGASVSNHFEFMYLFPVKFTIEYAQGTGSEGISQIYFYVTGDI